MPPKEKRRVRWTKGLTKEEKQQKVLERQFILKKEHLLREIKMGVLNTKKYRQSWRELMIRAKMPVIKEDIEHAWHTFDRVIDNKDHSIQILIKSLEEAKEQCERSKNGHSEMIRCLFNIYKMRMKAISTTYQSKINEILNEVNTDIIGYRQKGNEDLSQLQSIISIMQEQLDNSLNNTKSKTMSKIDSFIEDKTNVRRLALVVKENEMNDFSAGLQKTIATYHKNTKNRRKLYDVVKEKDEKNQQIITKQYVRISVLSETISTFREKMATHKANVKKHLKEIMDEQNFFYTSYWIMKNRFISEQKQDRAQLTITAIEYKLTKNYLERLIKKIESLLRLLLICNKYETINENIYSYANYKESSPRKIFSISELKGSEEIIHNFQDLTNFWRRIGIVQVTIEELKLEKEDLRKEINELRKIIQCYLSQETKTNLIS
ncbi:dynein regulatory complex subunit 2-like [Vespula squamosa]|uniref:Dynein regulatory complex subunit 2 n=1 Tax=Vespula squamosa TaxID=30214 RepID=A0ABD2B1H5_VESSQ